MDRIKRREFLHKLSLLGLGMLGGYSVIGCNNSNKREKAMIVKDIFGNDIELDSNGNIILKKERVDYKTIFDNEVKKTLITDEEFLKQNTLIATRLFNETNTIMQSSPYANYKPIYFDPTLKTNPNHFKEFKAWRDLYLKEPPKGKIAPWTKQEKAYYESLKTKRERYKYLVIRSGIRSSVIDIPLDAIANVDENGKLINEEYAELYAIVEANRGNANMAYGFLTMAEWEIAAGMLGDIKGFSALRKKGFTARTYQTNVLAHQLGVMWEGGYYGKYGSLIDDGTYNNPLRVAQAMNISKKIKPDRFGMYPYIDELVPPEWVQEFAKPNDTFRDGLRAFGPDLWDMYAKGKLLDPAMKPEQSTKESREEVRKFITQNLPKYIEQYDYGIIDNMTLSGEITETNPFGVKESQAPDWSPKRYAYVYIQALLTESKVLAPQGYPNAPYYYFPEELDELYEAGKLDKKLNPTIPAIYRETFPQELRDKIEWYAKKHKIK